MKENKNSTYFPILVDLKKFPCLVIGGGEVALRKVQSLQDFNAKITIISPKICKPLKELIKKNKIKFIRKSYSKKYIKNNKIVICATNNPKVNKKVHKDCSIKSILLNVVDIPELCNFIVPANVKRGDLSVSISSQGKAPFYVKEVKKKLDEILPSYYAELIELAGEFRRDVLNNKKINSSKKKEQAFNKFLNIDWEYILVKVGRDSANKRLRNLLKELR